MKKKKQTRILTYGKTFISFSAKILENKTSEKEEEEEEVNKNIIK